MNDWLTGPFTAYASNVSTASGSWLNFSGTNLLGVSSGSLGGSSLFSGAGGANYSSVGDTSKSLAEQLASFVSGSKDLADSTLATGLEISGATVSLWDKISNYFLRGTVIILGFIFVAVGLSMFVGGKAMPVVINTMGKGAE